MTQVTTKQETITDAEISALLDNPDAQSVIVPPVEPTPTPAAVTTPATPATPSTTTTPAEPVLNPTEVDDVLDNLDIEEEEEENGAGADPDKKAAKKQATASMATVINKLIEKKTLLPFEGDDHKLETDKDIEELLISNLGHVREEGRVEGVQEIFDSVPEKVQHILKYVADGGQNVEALIVSLASATKSEQLDITKPEGQEQAIRQYWAMTNYGTAEEIEEELNTLKDMPGALEKKATQLKPRLDAKHKEILDEDLKRQEKYKEQRVAAAGKYREDVYNALSKGTLGEVKITPKIQNMLYEALTEANFKSLTGQKTNLFGHLIEKYQYVEPKPELIAEATWLLNDPEGYRASIKAVGATAEVVNTVKALKTSSQTRNSGASPAASGDNNPIKKPGEAIKRPKPNIFART